MKQASAPPNETIPTIEVDEELSPMNGDGLLEDLNLFWRIIRKSLWGFVILFITVTSFSFWYSNNYATYTSTAKFAIIDWSQAYSPRDNNSIYTPDRVNQMLMLFLSDSVVQFLIKKYDMVSTLKHPDDIREQEELQSNIASSISLEPSVFNSFNLKVKTPDRFRSANIANDIVYRVMELSRRLYANDLANRINVLKNLLSTIPGTDSVSGDLLESHFAIIQQQLNKFVTNSLSADELNIVMSELDALKKQYDDRLIQLKLNELMLKEVSSSGISTITLIQKAIPDFTNYYIPALIRSLIIAAFICSLLPVMIYLLSSIRQRSRM